MNDKAHHIRKRFPNKNHTIDLIMAGDQDFRAICEDLNDCVNALRYWGRSKAPEAKTRVEEYRTLIEELEEEINQALEAMNPQRSA